MSTPTTGHPYLDEGGPVLAFAHRGGGLHPDIVHLENSLRAFQHAHDLGYAYLETDVHLTADGVLVAFHDDVLDRVTDSAGAVSALTYAEVRAARIAGAEPIPTMAELLDALPSCRFNIDLKSDAAVRPLVDLIRERGDQSRVLVGSFSRARLQQFRALLPEVPTSASPLEAAVLKFVPWAPLALRLGGQAPVALQVPRARGPLEVVTRRFVRRMHRMGKHVHVWTIDDAAEMNTLLDRGVDGVMTDRTDILKTVLTERGHWKDDS